MLPNTAGTWYMELEPHKYVYMHSGSLAKPLCKNKQINTRTRGTANTFHALLVRTLLASTHFNVDFMTMFVIFTYNHCE